MTKMVIVVARWLIFIGNLYLWIVYRFYNNDYGKFVKRGSLKEVRGED